MRRAFEQIVAGDGGRRLRGVVQQRTYAGVGADHVGRADLLAEIAVGHLAQVGDLAVVDLDLARFALVFEVGGADQGELVLVGNGEDDALVRILEDVGIRMAEQARHDNVAALDQAQPVAIAAAGRVGHFARPWSGRVDDSARLHFDAAVVFAVQRSVPALALLLHGHALGAGEDGGAPFAGVQRIEHHEAGIVDPAVGIDEALAVVALERRARLMSAQRDTGRRRQELAVRQVIVQEQAGPYHPRRTLAGVVRHDKAQRAHDVRRGAQQHFALLQGFAHQLEFVVFEIAQAAVNQLGAGRRGVLRQVVLFAQDHAQATADGVTGDAGAIDAAAHDQQIAGARGHGGRGRCHHHGRQAGWRWRCAGQGGSCWYRFICSFLVWGTMVFSHRFHAFA